MGLASQLKQQSASAPPQGGPPVGYPGGPPQQAGPYPPQMPAGYPPQMAAAPGYPGQPYPAAQPYPGQPATQPYPGQPYPGQPYPGQPAYPQGFAAPPTQHPFRPQAALPPSQGLESVIGAKLQKIVQYNQLHALYPPARLQEVVRKVATTVNFDALAARWRMPKELAIDLASLALYDIVIYADDSGSMESYGGERIEDLQLIMAKVAEVATLFDDDGIEVRFINSNRAGNHIKSGADAERLLQGMEYRYDTKIAAQMEAKILQPMAYSRPLQKPLLIITITDGEPSDKPKDRIIQTIQDCRRRLSAQYGPKAVAFQFAQVGKDQEAQEFLSKLDNDPAVGSSIDCTSYYELESAEYAKKGIHLSVEAWLVKLMVGAIDPEYDEQDE